MSILELLIVTKIKLTPRMEQTLFLIVKIFKEEIVYAFNRFLFIVHSRMYSMLGNNYNTHKTLLQAYKVWTKLLLRRLLLLCVLPSHHHNTICYKSINTLLKVFFFYNNRKELQESARMSQSVWEGVKHCAKADRKKVSLKKYNNKP